MAGSHHPERSARPWPRLPTIVLIIILTAVLAGVSRILADGDGHDWRMIGHDPSDTRSQPFERSIRPENVGQLAVKWVATTTGDVSATPAVVDDAVYFGDFGGTLWKLNADTGDVIWSHVVSDYTGIPGDLTRTSPSLAGHTVLIGDLSAPNMMGIRARSSRGRRFSPATRFTSARRKQGCRPTRARWLLSRRRQAPYFGEATRCLTPMAFPEATGAR